MAKDAAVEGYLLVADISGYTSLLTNTELKHSSDIIQAILSNIHKNIRSPFTFVKYEGDAILYYLNGKKLNEGDRIIDHIEAVYTDFMSQLLEMKLNTNCPCKACAGINNLNLKFFGHYGEFMLQKLPGTGMDIVGYNVILLHRLMKNNIYEKHQTKGYAALTESCMKKTGKPSYTIDYSANYEDIGNINCGVINLSENYKIQQKKAHFYIEPEACDFKHEGTFETSPETLWNYCIDSKLRRLWQGNTFSVVNKRNKQNRFGVGSETHCVHGGYKRTSKYVDVRPFQYYTMKCTYVPSIIGPPMYALYELIPKSENITQLSIRIRILRRDRFTMFLTKLILPFAMKLEMNYKKLKRVMKEREKEEDKMENNFV